jgi:transcription initiation factor TFIIH subunit 4
MSVSSLRSFEYLESLPGTVFNRLYKQPSTALAIFRRMLPHLGIPLRLVCNQLPQLIDQAKSFVMALLYLSQPLPVSDLESWVRSDSKRYAQSCWQELF